MIRKKSIRPGFRLTILWLFALFPLNLYAAEVDDGVTHISQVEFQTMRSSPQPPVVIDVRTKFEYFFAHIPGAANIPHYKIMRKPALLAPFKGQPMIFYCHVGVRVKTLTDQLVAAGLGSEKTLFHLKGDMRAWRARNLPTVR